ncbi:MAG: hypothetical protein AAFO63_13560, partial [Pseudomonadota bacterium]
VQSENFSPNQAVYALREYLDDTRGNAQEIGQSKVAQGLFDAMGSHLIGENLSEQTYRALDFRDGRLTDVDSSGSRFFLSDFRGSKIFGGRFSDTAFVLSDLSSSDLEIAEDSVVYFSGARLDGSRVVANNGAEIYLSATTFEDAQFSLHPSSKIIIDRSDGSRARDHGSQFASQLNDVRAATTRSGDASSPRTLGAAEKSLAVATTFRHVEIMPSSCLDLADDQCEVDLRFDFAPAKFVDELEAQIRFDRHFLTEAPSVAQSVHWSEVNGSAQPGELIDFKLPRIVLGETFDSVADFVADQINQFVHFEQHGNTEDHENRTAHDLLKRTSSEEQGLETTPLLDLIIAKANLAEVEEVAPANEQVASGLDLAPYAAAAKEATAPRSAEDSAPLTFDGVILARTPAFDASTQLAIIESAEFNDYLVYGKSDDGWQFSAFGSAPNYNQIIVPTAAVEADQMLLAQINELQSGRALALSALRGNSSLLSFAEAENADAVVVFFARGGFYDLTPSVTTEAASCESGTENFCVARGSGVQSKWSILDDLRIGRRPEGPAPFLYASECEPNVPPESLLALYSEAHDRVISSRALRVASNDASRPAEFLNRVHSCFLEALMFDPESTELQVEDILYWLKATASLETVLTFEHDYAELQEVFPLDQDAEEYFLFFEIDLGGLKQLEPTNPLPVKLTLSENTIDIEFLSADIDVGVQDVAILTHRAGRSFDLLFGGDVEDGVVVSAL